MTHFNSDGFLFGWGWILWLGFIFLVFSSFGNWGYAYRAHRKLDGAATKDASALLNERYASGELTRAQFLEMKAD
ncbi:MAG: SHOCT domain-containing protein, partial [Rhizomicrobium sp.]